MRTTFGPILLHLGITLDYVETAKALTDEQIALDVEKVRKQFTNFTEEGLGDVLSLSSKHYLTMKKLAADHNLDALAVRCWPELPGPPTSGGMGGWCYMALARLASEGLYF